MRNALIALAIALSVALSWPAFAAPVDLSGTWVLDLAASGDLDPLLEARGASWVERKAAANMQVTKTITQSSDTLKLDIVTSAKSQSEEVVVDGQSRQRTTNEGEQATVTNRWEGRAWVNVTAVTVEPGVAVTVTQTHLLSEDGQTLTQRIQFVKGDAPPIQVDRVFRRQ